MEPIEKKQMLASLSHPGRPLGTYAQTLFYFGTFPELMLVILKNLPELDVVCLLNRLLRSKQEREDQHRRKDPLVVTILPHLCKMVVVEFACLQWRNVFSYPEYRDVRDRDVRDHGDDYDSDGLSSEDDFDHTTARMYPLLGPARDLRCLSVVSGTEPQSSGYQFVFPKASQGHHNECQVILEWIKKDGRKYPVNLKVFDCSGSLMMECSRDNDSVIVVSKYAGGPPRPESHVPHPLKKDRGALISRCFEELHKFPWEFSNTVQRWTEFFYGECFDVAQNLYIRRTSPLDPSESLFYPMGLTGPVGRLEEMNTLQAMPDDQLCSTRAEAENMADDAFFNLDLDLDSDDSDDDFLL